MSYFCNRKLSKKRQKSRQKSIKMSDGSVQRLRKPEMVFHKKIENSSPKHNCFVQFSKDEWNDSFKLSQKIENLTELINQTVGMNFITHETFDGWEYPKRAILD
jgi:hypothetical protein